MATRCLQSSLGVLAPDLGGLVGMRGSHAGHVGKNFLGQKSSRCKSPGAGPRLAGSWNSPEAQSLDWGCRGVASQEGRAVRSQVRRAF